MKIKNSVFALLAAIFALISTSCYRIVDADTGEVLGGNVPYGNQGGQMDSGGRRLGQQVIGQRKITTTHTVKPFVKVGGDAPAEVCRAVSESTANEVSLIAQKSVRPGQKPVWPTFGKVTNIAGDNFARLGYRLSPGNEGQPGCYKVMTYKTGM